MSEARKTGAGHRRPVHLGRRVALKGRSWMAVVTAVCVLWHAAIGCCAHHQHDASQCSVACTHSADHCESQEADCLTLDGHETTGCCHDEHPSMVELPTDCQAAFHAEAVETESLATESELHSQQWGQRSESQRHHPPCSESSCCLTAPLRSETCISHSLNSVLACVFHFDSIVPLSQLKAAERNAFDLNSQGSSSAHPRHLLFCVLIQ